VLSVESTGIANLLEEEDIEGYAGLTLACMYEYSQGEESVWSAYLALLAESRPQMPSDLSQDARELLKKSEVYGDIETDLVRTQDNGDGMEGLCVLKWILSLYSLLCLVVEEFF
jgi:hypothetical protein